MRGCSGLTKILVAAGGLLDILQNREAIQPALPPQNQLKVMNIPADPTRLIQPLDVYFFLPFKNMCKPTTACKMQKRSRPSNPILGPMPMKCHAYLYPKPPLLDYRRPWLSCFHLLSALRRPPP
uniref:Secreted protein n=1 Tax=Haemonchus contortus TaxID=6289 RepID=A0A7I4Z6A2_HAECO